MTKDLQTRFNNGDVIEFDKPTIVLASASPRRSRLLDSTGIEYVKILSGLDDSEFNYDFPHENVTHKQTRKYAEAMAIAKLEPFKNRIVNGAVVTADSTVFCRGRILEKPHSIEHCREQHELISGKTNYAYNAIAVYYNGKITSKVLRVRLRIKPLPEHIIDEICNEPEILDCAGYRHQGAIGPYCSFKTKNSASIIAGLNVPVVEKLLKRVGY